jgi:glycosyltransferase involved in cell wall biosynthesis
MNSPRITVIMASYLDHYTSGGFEAASNREFKFRRAVNSFLDQTFKSAELIIVSDGCEKTSKITREKYSNFSAVRLIELPKQPLFSGTVRQAGLTQSTGEIVCYLDSDDYFGSTHLEILSGFKDSEYVWCYYDDYIFNGEKKWKRTVEPKANRIGTSSICHRRACSFQWADGYGHDWTSISHILKEKHYKIDTPDYVVCHLGKIDA